MTWLLQLVGQHPAVAMVGFHLFAGLSLIISLDTTEKQNRHSREKVVEKLYFSFWGPAAQHHLEIHSATSTIWQVRSRNSRSFRPFTPKNSAKVELQSHSSIAFSPGIKPPKPANPIFFSDLRGKVDDIQIDNTAFFVHPGCCTMSLGLRGSSCWDEEMKPKEIGGTFESYLRVRFLFPSWKSLPFRLQTGRMNQTIHSATSVFTIL